MSGTQKTHTKVETIEVVNKSVKMLCKKGRACFTLISIAIRHRIPDVRCEKNSARDHLSWRHAEAQQFFPKLFAPDAPTHALNFASQIINGRRSTVRAWAS
jgi:hypothetical protein